MSKLSRKFSENQIEFANEIQKQFTFEQLALCFYDNECEYCPKQDCCSGKVSTKDCVENICRKFKETYELREVEE